MGLTARIRHLEATPAVAGRVCPDCGHIPGTCLLPGGRCPEYKVEFEREMGATSENEYCPTCGALLVAVVSFDRRG
jgi:hypothetical protein